jgi:uncharacterized protein (TIGR00288 family)
LNLDISPPYDTSAPPSVALYWDFENLHAALVEEQAGEGAYAKPDARFKVQPPLIEIQAIVNRVSEYGSLAINRAYCNWQYFGRYRDALLQAGIELIQLFPPGASAKNGADIRLCLDAVDDVARLSHVRTVAVVGGDSDFMPLAHKLKAAGRHLVGIGARVNTNRHWAANCHDFHYYDTLAASSPARDSGAAKAFDPEATITLSSRPDLSSAG